MYNYKYRRFKSHIRYYWKKIWEIIGICPVCFSRYNYTRYGKAICPRGCHRG